jgi:DNA-binding NarL/FixJ family response regulator
MAVETLAQHKPFFTAYATRMIVDRFNLGQGVTKIPEQIRERLTAREREAVRLIAGGENSKEVASHLGISIKTSETHRANIMRKLEIHSISELVRYAVRNEIVEE